MMYDDMIECIKCSCNEVAFANCMRADIDRIYGCPNYYDKESVYYEEKDPEEIRRLKEESDGR